MAEYGRKGVELLKEILNHDNDSLSAYNVRATASRARVTQTHTCTCHVMCQLHAEEKGPLLHPGLPSHLSCVHAGGACAHHCTRGA